MDKEKALIEFLMTCNYVHDNPLFFNFINAKDNNKQLITMANDRALNKPYIDGSVRKRYSFTIVDFKSVAYIPLVNQLNISNENVDDYLQVQQLVDWITEQNELRNYPDFGQDCIIDSMVANTDNPNLNGVDTNVKPALAKYSVSIQIEYVDTSKTIWNKEDINHGV